MNSEFRIEIRNEGDTALIQVRGELDLSTTPLLEERLQAALGSEAVHVVVDLRELEFMDSTGLSILVKAHQRALDAGRSFALIKGPQQVQRLLTLTGVADRVTLLDSPEQLHAGS